MKTALVLQVNKLPVFDIFLGEGWDNHTRVSRERGGTYLPISGNKLHKSLVNHIMSTFKPKPPLAFDYRKAAPAIRKAA